MIRPYLSDQINIHKTQGEQKIKSTVTTSFFPKDSEETCTMYSPSDNTEVMIGIEKDEIIEKLFNSLLQRYQRGLGESVKGILMVMIYCITNFIE